MELVSKFGSLLQPSRKTNANSQLEQKLGVFRAMCEVFRNCVSKCICWQLTVVMFSKDLLKLLNF